MSNTNPSQHNPLSLVWLRRDLRLHDHSALAESLDGKGPVQPVFVFDSDILSRFSSSKDRRLTFIADALWKIHSDLAKMNSGVLIIHGSARQVMPKLAQAVGAGQVTCAEDFEPDTIRRDEAVASALATQGVGFTHVLDHLVFSPRDVLKADGTPYLVFTPYSKAWRSKLDPYSFAEQTVSLSAARMADFAALQASARQAGLKVLDMQGGAKGLLEQIGYEHHPHPLWAIENGQKRLRDFISGHIGQYKQARDYMAQDGTSMLSPYLRHGIVSVRELLRLAVEKPQHETWLNELIWREFYAMVLYHFPQSVTQELQEKYRDLPWSHDQEKWAAFVECRTGYPVVDAAMRQLHATGWMHNRARMIVASFLTKDLHIDWRWGEEHFAQWLMDYELASNVGGWQWAASTGTDAAPYFRVFNPVTQSERFDAEGAYIRQWLPELAVVKGKDIHMPPGLLRPKDYPAPLVDHKEAREIALSMFKKAGSD
jgi:deoxyribodipyrimidine photo-lyase